MRLHTDPFHHWIADDWAPPELCRAALAEWPDEHWPHWLRYDGRQGTKYATKDASRLPPACAELVRSMLSLPVERLTGISGTFPDVHLHGAGMHMIPPRGELPLHLDSDHNPVTGYERALSGILFLNEWQPAWGAELALWCHPDDLITKIMPQCGRLVLFEASDLSWHSVLPVWSGAPQSRCTLSVFWWRKPTKAEYARPRAEFACAEKKG